MTNSLPVNLRAGRISDVGRCTLFSLLPPDEKVFYLAKIQQRIPAGRVVGAVVGAVSERALGG